VIEPLDLRAQVISAICPNCGCNLRRFAPFAYGNVAIDARGQLMFEGHPLPLPRSQHLIVEALVKAEGRGLTRSLLATIIGSEIYDQTVSKYIERIRSSFRRVQPDFDQISALRGFGAYRWDYRRSTSGEVA
jgi:DNA-binding response OmpR family regulator